MKLKVLFLLTGMSLITACATGKSVDSAENIRDDGKSNVAAFTYDVTLLTTEKYATVNSTKLNFRCPQDQDLQKTCFTVNVPYAGRKRKDEYTTHEFKSSGSKVVSIKYGTYDMTSVRHSVVVDRIPDVYCYYNKRTKRNVCNRRMKDESVNHTASFPEPVGFAINPGSGCYLGHLSMLMHNNVIEAYDFQHDIGQLSEKLDTFPEGMRGAVAAHIDRAC